jgi:hypothetical protein
MSENPSNSEALCDTSQHISFIYGEKLWNPCLKYQDGGARPVGSPGLLTEYIWNSYPYMEAVFYICTALGRALP